MKIEIRYAKLEDATRLVEIYRYYVEKTAITFEYEVPSIEEFQQRMIHVMEKYPYLVAKVDDQIVGYVYASTFNVRAAYDWCVETSIYVDHTLRKCGVGKKTLSSFRKSFKSTKHYEFKCMHFFAN